MQSCSRFISIVRQASIEIEVSHNQYNIEKKYFNISQIIRNETENIRSLSIKAKVISVDEVTLVGSHPNKFQKRNIHVEDTTGGIVLVLWRDRAE